MMADVESSLISVMYQVANSLFVPVLVAVLLLFAVVLVIGGGFLRECLDRRAIRWAITQAVALCDESPPKREAAWAALEAVGVGLPAELAEKGLWQHPHRMGHKLRTLETAVAAQLARLTFIARVGPILGLLGTLIPFGPALTGLSTGDVKLLSTNLVAAFATTVVGLLSGCVAFGMGLVRKGWYARDLDDLEYIVERLGEAKETVHEKEEASMGIG